MATRLATPYTPANPPVSADPGLSRAVWEELQRISIALAAQQAHIEQLEGRVTDLETP